MTELYIREDNETVKKQSLRVRNNGYIKTMMTVPNGEAVINNSLKNQKDTGEIENYNNNRREHIAISVLFTIGLFLQVISNAIL